MPAADDPPADPHQALLSFIRENDGMPFRSFYRKWLASPQVRLHTMMMATSPVAEGVSLLRALINKVHATPQSQDTSREEVRPVVIFLGGAPAAAAAQSLGFAYAPMQIPGSSTLLTGPAGPNGKGGNGDGNGAG